MFQRFQKEMKAFINEAIEISYWSRGALPYPDAFELTPIERDQWNDWLKRRLEQESARPYPCY